MRQCMYCGSLEHPGPWTGRGKLTPRSIWLGMGVPSYVVSECSRTSGMGPGYVYFAEALGASRIKIGWTAGDPRTRIESFITACPFPVVLLAHLPGTQKVEAWLHSACREAHAHNEWFHATDDLRALAGVVAAIPGFCKEIAS